MPVSWFSNAVDSCVAASRCGPMTSRRPLRAAVRLLSAIKRPATAARSSAGSTTANRRSQRRVVEPRPSVLIGRSCRVVAEQGEGDVVVERAGVEPLGAGDQLVEQVGAGQPGLVLDLQDDGGHPLVAEPFGPGADAALED